MSGKTYGYVRVSTKNQNEERQLIALREYGVPEKQIVVEKRSGKDFNRPMYQKLLRRLQQGDTLVIQSLDRLGRDYIEIQEQWRVITKERGASIVVLDMPLLCTRENQELINRLIADLVLQLFSFVAQTEREKNRERQRQGIDAAKARGVKFGRPRAELPGEFPEIVARWDRGEFTAREAAKMLGISRTTFFQRVREMAASEKADEPSEQAVSGETAGEFLNTPALEPIKQDRNRPRSRNCRPEQSRNSSPAQMQETENDARQFDRKPFDSTSDTITDKNEMFMHARCGMMSPLPKTAPKL